MEENSYNKKSIYMQILLGIVTNVTNLSLGANLGFSSIALPTMIATDGITQNDASWIASSMAVSIPVGCLLTGPIIDNFGRKISLSLVNIISLLGWIFIGCAPDESDARFIMLITGRVVSGVACGLGSTPATVYLSEISTPEMRDILTTWTSVFVAIGVLIIYTLGFFFKKSWRTSALIMIFLPIISQILLLVLMPESPAWLINQKNNIAKAEKNLAKIRCQHTSSPKVTEEIEKLVENKLENRVFYQSSLKFKDRIAQKFHYLFRPVVFKPLLIMVTFFFFQHSSGTFVLIFYAVDIIQHAGVTADSYMIAIFLALSRIIASCFLGLLCRRFGRRIPTIFSGVLMSISMGILVTYLYSTSRGVFTPGNEEKWLPVTLLIFYFFTSTFGFLTMPFAMIAEVFPTRIRGLASGIVACSCYVFNFIFVKTYHDMTDTTGQEGAFAFYGSMALIGTVFVVVFLPETKGKTLQEIENLYARETTTENNKNVV